MQIRLLNGLQLSEKGLSVRIPRSKNLQRLFLQQGSLDGACGPYCIYMALIQLGLIRRKEILGLLPMDRRKRLGRLWSIMGDNNDVLFQKGTYLEDLEAALKESYGTLLNIDAVNHNSEEIIDTVKKSLNKDRPVIVGVNYKGGGHWLLAVGREVKPIGEQGGKLFFLDPSRELPDNAYWNCVIDTVPDMKRQKYRYRWQEEKNYVQFDEALVLSRK